MSLLFLLASIVAPCLSPAARSDVRTWAPPDTTVVLRVGGDVTDPVALRLDQLSAMAHVEAVATIHDRSVRYRGVPLRDILALAGPPEGGDLLRSVVFARAPDGYEVVFALAELSADFTDRIVLIADSRDGEPLPAEEGPIRLVVPWEKRGARSVRQIRELEVRVLPAADTIRVLSYNIHHGEGMDSVLDLRRLAELIADVEPDLVAVQEVDSLVDRTGRVDQASELGRMTGLEAKFGSFMPYQGGAYGMAVLSRLPVVRSRNLRLPDGDEPRTALAVTVRLPRTGLPLQFVGIHLYRTEPERLAQAISLEEQLRAEPGPTILAGDFNSRPGSDVMEHLADGWELVRKGADHFTFPSYAPDHEIDFVLLRPAGAFEILAQRVLDEPVASDHRPILVDLVVRR